MPSYDVNILDPVTTVRVNDAPDEMTAVCNVLNALGMRYRDTKFTVLPARTDNVTSIKRTARK